MKFENVDGIEFTKVKEIIKNLIDDLEAIDGEEIRELKAVKEAEQFLSKIENVEQSGKVFCIIHFTMDVD